MSGDQVLQNQLLSSENAANQKETIKNLKKSTTPNNTTVRVNGLEVQSKLNPNALEFIPSYVQNKPQIKLNEELRKLIFKEAIDGKLNQESKLKTEEYFVTKDNDMFENEELCENIKHVDDEIEENKKSYKDNNDNKVDLNIETNTLYMLYASPSEIRHTSSEVTIPEVDVNEPENTVIQIKEDKLIQNENEMKVNNLNTEENHSFEENVSKITNKIKEIFEANPENVNTKSHENIQKYSITPTDKSDSEHDVELLKFKSEKPLANENLLELCDLTKPQVQNIKEFCNEIKPENANKNNENFQESKISLTHKIESELLEFQTEKPQLNVNVFELCELRKPEIQNINEPSNAGVKVGATYSRGQNNMKIVKEVTEVNQIKDPKTKLNNNSKIAEPQLNKTGAIKKASLLVKPKIEVKECKQLNTTAIKLKTQEKITQNSKLAKNSGNHLITKTATNSKCHTLAPNKSLTQPFKGEMTNSANRDTISIISSSSTDKSSPSTKSSAQSSSSRVKSNEKPKTKETVTKSPRATVSSKLRKTETQKRRNLFFDLDTIKMSDFLFK